MPTTLLGKRLTEFRKLKGLTQEELAERCGVALATISRWETGSLSPKPRNLEKLAEVLEVSVSDFYHSEAVAIPDNVVIKETIELLTQLSRDEQLFVIYCLKKFIEVKEKNLIDMHSV